MIMINLLLLKNLTSKKFTARLKQASLASKSDIANFLRKIDLNKNELNELLKQYQQKD